MNRRAWYVLCVLIGFIGSAAGETVTVTSFGRGETKREAIESAIVQAVRDSSGKTIEWSRIGSLSPSTRSNRYLKQSKTISVEKIGPRLYQAQVEAMVSVVDSHERRLFVAVLADPNQRGNAMTSELVQNVRERIAHSSGVFIVDNVDPAVTVAVERLNSRERQKARRSADLGGTFELDFLYFISAGNVQRTIDLPAGDRFEMDVKVDMIDAANNSRRVVSTVKSTLSGAPEMVNRAIVFEAGKQVSILLSSKLSTVIADTSRSKHYVVRPGTIQNQNGIILDSDW